MARLILIRHTETIFNKAGIFTGTLDIPLSAEGVLQAKQQGTLLKNQNFDWVYVSALVRSKETAAILLEEYYQYHPDRIPVFLTEDCTDIHQKPPYLPIQADARLNEKFYGVCQGEKKAHMADMYGEDAVASWRRDWDTAPSGAESLKDICIKVRTVLEEELLPKLREGRDILLVCHQNPLRALKIVIEKIPEDQVQDIEFSNVDLLCYEYGQDDFISVKL